MLSSLIRRTAPPRAALASAVAFHTAFAPLSSSLTITSGDAFSAEAEVDEHHISCAGGAHSVAGPLSMPARTSVGGGSGGVRRNHNSGNGAPQVLGGDALPVVGDPRVHIWRDEEELLRASMERLKAERELANMRRRCEDELCALRDGLKVREGQVERFVRRATLAGACKSQCLRTAACGSNVSNEVATTSRVALSDTGGGSHTVVSSGRSYARPHFEEVADGLEISAAALMEDDDDDDVVKKNGEEGASKESAGTEKEKGGDEKEEDDDEGEEEAGEGEEEEEEAETEDNDGEGEEEEEEEQEAPRSKRGRKAATSTAASAPKSSSTSNGSKTVRLAAGKNATKRTSSGSSIKGKGTVPVARASQQKGKKEKATPLQKNGAKDVARSKSNAKSSDNKKWRVNSSSRERTTTRGGKVGSRGGRPAADEMIIVGGKNSTKSGKGPVGKKLKAKPDKQQSAPAKGKGEVIAKVRGGVAGRRSATGKGRGDVIGKGRGGASTKHSSKSKQSPPKRR
ncbi:hypothetical protein ERJ75_001665000 [Trypanosoma vivax]|uniref:Uncharacterized protein n=1 Tax=Trypanosoma vivax (strain Y486) TaxID=1055687 RepID=G0U8H5_TRYVY|nr:hypothetical protein TRVL_02545 [Trypanosoma vivax]KAH8605013.1 hypothetical protein ERJ75_001665000 [Trypanosoma vivax]CCC53901.1 conserved hypothetical protein [Trypanosoma vivax Y486]